MPERSQRQKAGLQAITIGFLGDVLLAISKTAVGIIGHSPALLADGIMSTSDVIYNSVVWIFIRISGKPADEEHPYGHQQLETIGALMVGAFIITTGITVIWNGLDQVFDLVSGVSDYIPSTNSALWIAFGTLLLKIILTMYTKAVGNRINNIAVSAVAQDHQMDVYSAAAVIAGILLARSGFHWAEPLFSVVIGILILKTGVDILRSSSYDLMDTVPGRKLNQEVPRILCSIEGIKLVDEIKTHRFGPYMAMNITISVDGNISVSKGHDIACKVEKILQENIDNLMDVHVHYHPFEIRNLKDSINCEDD